MIGLQSLYACCILTRDAGNTANSVSVSNNGFVQFTNGNANKLYAATLGKINASGVTGTPTFNPAANTRGNNEGYMIN